MVSGMVVVAKPALPDRPNIAPGLTPLFQRFGKRKRLASGDCLCGPFSISSPTSLDVLGLAILQASLAAFPPDGIVMHPSDWRRIRLTKDFEGR